VTLLLHFEAARIDSASGVLCQELSCRSEARTLGLVGDWSPLFRVLSCDARVTRGRATVLERPADSVVRGGIVGLALCDPELPARWTALEYLTESAALMGMSGAKSGARQALNLLGLEALSQRRLGQLNPVERRALMLAHAWLGPPQALALEKPLSRLDEAAQRYLMELIFRAASSVKIMVSVESVAEVGVERALLDRAEEVLVLREGVVVAQGSAETAFSPSARFLISVSKKAPLLAQRLVEMGCTVQVAQRDGLIATLGVTSAGSMAELADAARLIVEVENADTLLRLSVELEAPIHELEPLAQG
jgi:ABC-type multidrug transport system ATPase subunit